MEIRTCEQYVLAELENYRVKIDELISRNITLTDRTFELAAKYDELDQELDEIKCVLEVFYKYTEQTPYSGGGSVYHFTPKTHDEWEEMDEAYAKATEILNRE